MADAASRPIIVHALADALAAALAAAATGRPLLLVSGPAAGLYAGAGWFRELVHQARLAHPGVQITAVLDCAEEAGMAAEALSSGIDGVLFSGRSDVADKLRTIAAQTGSALHTALPPALEIRGERDPVEACRKWLAGDDRD